MPRINLIKDALPSTVMVGGSAFGINTDYRVGIAYEEVNRSIQLSETEKFRAALMLYFNGHQLPDDIADAYRALIQFYMCGTTVEEEEERRKLCPQEQIDHRRILDYNEDAQYIYAAFLDQYRIDLTDPAPLHWWRFRALFKGLKPENEIVKIMGYRSANLGKIKDKNERGRIRKLQDFYKLPVQVSTEEIQKRAGKIFGKLM